MKSILPDGRPALTALIYGGDLQQVKEETAKIIQQGADIIGFMLESYESDCSTEEGLKELIDAAQGKPIYVTDYLRGNTNPDLTDDDLHNTLMLALKLSKGKSNVLIDVRTDMYDSVKGELTLNEAAIEKQMKFIDEVHNEGGKVLMSCHIIEGFATPEHILFIAQEHQRRGADISKIVVPAPTEDDLFTNYEVSLKLRKELDIPYLFLCGGDFCYKHRRLNGALGSCMMLVRENSHTNQLEPTISEIQQVLTSLGYFDKKDESN